MISNQEHSLTEYLNLVKPFVSSDLIDPMSWTEIEAIAQQMPSQITSFFGFECRLGVAAAKADLLLCIATGEIGQKVLDGSKHADLFPKNWFKQPVWSHLRDFAACWQDKTSPLHEKVSNIWLEFDVAETDDQALIPSCFFGSSFIFADPSSTTHHQSWITQTAISMLRGQPLLPLVEQHLFRCINALPTGAYVFQIGLMLSRRSEMVRICLRGIAGSHLSDYLQQVRWSGSTAALQAQVMEIATYVDRIDLDLDIGETGVASRIGLECYLFQQPKFQPKWQAFLDYLVNAELCLPQKREALLSYPGHVREKNHRTQWPTHLLNLSKFLGNNHESVFMRGLHHIKLVYQDERVQEAKAYCWVTHQMVSRQSVPSLRDSQRLSIQIENFLTPEEHCQLLDFVSRSESDFLPSKTFNDTDEGSYDIFHRNSLIYEPALPALSEGITQRIRKTFLNIMAQLEFPQFDLSYIEAQLTAHNNDHYYKLHNDSSTPKLAGRQITFVYYFYCEPKPFSGGELRIFSSTAENTTLGYGASKLIEPLNNSIVFFPSRYLHEVLPIHCPSKAFTDSRFTVNGWLWQADPLHVNVALERENIRSDCTNSTSY
jgi:Rps23 Pro-64 3,4-dihydroxylase Tpa1-like proline 4-hydroxylase